MKIDYDAYRKYLIHYGASPEEADEAVEEMREIEAYLNKLVCPDCEGHLFRVVTIEDDGIFGTYTCSKCNAFCASRPEAGLGAA